MSTVSQKTIRAWARRQGIKVGERGRLHPDVLEAYEARRETPLPSSAERRILLAEPVEYDKRVHKYTCGFCANGTSWGHERCPSSTKNGSSVGSDAYCACALQNHERN